MHLAHRCDPLDAFGQRSHLRMGNRYGLATWDCFRKPPGAPGYLALAQVVALAEAAGGADHGFRCGTG